MKVVIQQKKQTTAGYLRTTIIGFFILLFLVRDLTSSRSNTSSLMTELKTIDQQQQSHQLPVPHDHEYPFTFGACLLTKDDSQILPEWIAYHYTVLPLRHLIVAIDPLSITTPEPTILDNFRNHTNLYIETWTGNWYFEDGRWSREKYGTFDPNNHTVRHAFDMHNTRQRAFYTHCLRRLKALNVTWVFIGDTDEYFTYNTILPSEKATEAGVEERFPRRAKLPQKIGKQNETVAHTIANNETEYKDHLCIVYPRVQFSAKDPNISSTMAVLPHGFNLKSFHTLRFTSYRDIYKYFPGKSLVNLARVSPNQRVGDPHRPFQKKCTGSVSPYVSEKHDYAFRVHHYSGSLETFLSRKERTKDYWERQNNFIAEGDDHSLSEWFHEFVKLVGGEKQAYQLTELPRDIAYKESIQIKIRVEQHNESIPPVYEWDSPLSDAEKRFRESNPRSR